MSTEKDIFEKIGKPSYGVPEGYFDDLKARLGTIAEEKVASPGIWMRVRPYLALAACFAAILLAGNLVLRNTGTQSPDKLLNEVSYAEMISITQPEALYDAFEYEHEDISDEDIIDYLIESGATMEHLAYAGGQR